jgi:hypothetical protein
MIETRLPNIYTMMNQFKGGGSHLQYKLAAQDENNDQISATILSGLENPNNSQFQSGPKKMSTTIDYDDT